jgi:hypothetical protein
MIVSQFPFRSHSKGLESLQVNEKCDKRRMKRI